MTLVTVKDSSAKTEKKFSTQSLETKRHHLSILVAEK